jgi:hypothetical protein
VFGLVAIAGRSNFVPHDYILDESAKLKCCARVSCARRQRIIGPRPVRLLRPSSPFRPKIVSPTLVPFGYRGRDDETIFRERNYTPMAVHDGFRFQAAFLSFEEWDGVNQPEPFGTVFFVHVHLDPDASYRETHPGVIYAVTAKHNLVDIPADYPVYITVNKFGGGYVQERKVWGDWVTHPDTNIDVAVSEMPRLTDAVHGAVQFPSLITSQTRNTIRLGDSVFTVGVYSGIRGKRFRSIARFGNISLMPDAREKIKIVITDADKTKDYDDLPEIEAYLVEVRGWEGQSGSPVFVSFGKTENFNKVAVTLVEPQMTLTPNGMQMNPPAIWPHGVMVFRPDPVCIGLIQGYHPDEMETDDPSFKYKVNLGISIVVSSEAIVDILMKPELVADRAERLAAIKQKGDESS